jgi:hypothetical protein
MSDTRKRVERLAVLLDKELDRPFPDSARAARLYGIFYAEREHLSVELDAGVGVEPKIETCPHSVSRDQYGAPVPCGEPVVAWDNLCELHCNEREERLRRGAR